MVDNILVIQMNIKMMFTPQLSEDICIKVATFGLKLESHVGILQGGDQRN